MLKPDKTRYENGVLICEKIMPNGTKSSRYIASWVPAGGNMKPERYMNPIGITIHNTNDLVSVNEDSEQYVRATYEGNMAGAIVHYYVDDISAWQLLSENETGWHASDGSGNGNTRTIAIECIMDGSGSKEDLKARDNAARLIAAIMKRYGWNISNLYTHNHWMGQPDKIVYGVRKNCPYYLLPKYDEFKALVNSYLGSTGGTVVNSGNSTTSGSSTTSGISYTSINVGDIYEFKGNLQYVSSVKGAKSVGATATRVKVTRKAASNAAHPLHVRSVDSYGKYTSSIYGWIDLEDLQPLNGDSFLVQVTSSNLNVRKGPGVLNSIVTTIRDKGIYTIVETKNSWGLLKSYRKNKDGWINLSYTKRI